MANQNSTRLFGYSGLHFASMKVKAFVLALLIFGLAGCGGSPAHLSPAPLETLTADAVFSNTPQKWEFVSQCQNLQPDGSRDQIVEAHTFIDVMPVDATHTVWHYTKDQPCAYWMPEGIDAELYFFLEQDTNGAWYSTGGHIIAPFGFPWDKTHAPQDFTYSVTFDSSKPRPYLIIPAQSTGDVLAMVTTFADVQGPNTPWETDSQTVSVTTPVYSGFAMLSHQIEGDCKPSCADEGWAMAANGTGMVQVTVYNIGSGPLAVPIVLTRIN